MDFGSPVARQVTVGPRKRKDKSEMPSDHSGDPETERGGASMLIFFPLLNNAPPVMSSSLT